MKSASKRERARHAAAEEADEMMALKDRLAVMNEEVSAGLGGARDNSEWPAGSPRAAGLKTAPARHFLPSCALCCPFLPL
jgi:hypothetical protein